MTSRWTVHARGQDYNYSVPTLFVCLFFFHKTLHWCIKNKRFNFLNAFFSSFSTNLHVCCSSRPGCRSSCLVPVVGCRRLQTHHNTDTEPVVHQVVDDVAYHVCVHLDLTCIIGRSQEGLTRPVSMIEHLSRISRLWVNTTVKNSWPSLFLGNKNIPLIHPSGYVLQVTLRCDGPRRGEGSRTEVGGVSETVSAG